MSEEVPNELSSLTAALKAAEVETTEAYFQSDWRRVWELTNNEIPKLEREIATLKGLEVGEFYPSTIGPLDYERISIEFIDTRNSFFNVYLKRQPSFLKRVKVLVTFSNLQLAVIEKESLNNAVFYESTADVPVRVSELVNGPWTSKPLSEWDANSTAENARDGINDLRLIIQARARRDRR